MKLRARILQAINLVGPWAYMDKSHYYRYCFGMPINRVSFKIGDVMRELAKHKQVPRIENIFRLAGREILQRYQEKQSTQLIDEAIWFFVRNHKHHGHQFLQHHDLQGISSADVGDWFSDDIEFFSRKGFVIQEMLMIKEMMVHKSIFLDFNIEDYIEQRLRNIEVAAPDVVNDILYGTYIPFTPHFSLTEPRPNTEVLSLK